jgi:methionine sulfoxide reductase heme-binding subunit
MMHRWPLVFGLIAGLLALFVGLQAGADHVENWRLAARWTARAGFPIFILTYSASSLGRLWHVPWTRTLWRDRRWWGLGFAAAHTVHLYALITFLKVSGETRPLPVLLGGGIGYGLLYAMVLTSDEAAMRALGKNWKRLHTLGIHWLWAVFFISYAGRAVKPGSMNYGLFAAIIALAALGLRITAWARGRRNRA